MAKITNPVRFSTHFKIAPEKLAKLAVLDPTLNVDTRLFIDPFLIEGSAHPEIARNGRATYEKHFRQIIGLLSGSKKRGVVPWRNARRLLQFPVSAMAGNLFPAAARVRSRRTASSRPRKKSSISA